MKYQVLVEKVRCDQCKKTAPKNYRVEQGGLDFCDKFCLANYNEHDRLQSKLFSLNVPEQQKNQEGEV